MKIIAWLIVLTCLGIISYSLSLITQPKVVPLAITVSPTAEPTPTKEPSINADKLLEVVNEWRVSENRQPFVKDERLCAIAQDRVLNDPPMDNHAGLYKKYSNLPYAVGENLGKTFPEEVMLSHWLFSPGHAAALRKPWTYTCIACNGIYCSQIFSSF